MYPWKCSIWTSWILTNHCLTLHVWAAAVCWPNILCQLYWWWCPVQSPIQGHPSPSLQRSVAGVSLQEKYMLGISLHYIHYIAHQVINLILSYTYVFKPDMPLKHVSTLTLMRIALLYSPSPIVLCWWEKKHTSGFHALLLCKLQQHPTNKWGCHWRDSWELSLRSLCT